MGCSDVTFEQSFTGPLFSEALLPIHSGEPVCSAPVGSQRREDPVRLRVPNRVPMPSQIFTQAYWELHSIKTVQPGVEHVCPHPDALSVQHSHGGSIVQGCPVATRACVGRYTYVLSDTFYPLTGLLRLPDATLPPLPSKDCEQLPKKPRVVFGPEVNRFHSLCPLPPVVTNCYWLGFKGAGIPDPAQG